jgi:hypothetical protein
MAGKTIAKNIEKYYRLLGNLYAANDVQTELRNIFFAPRRESLPIPERLYAPMQRDRYTSFIESRIRLLDDGQAVDKYFAQILRELMSDDLVRTRIAEDRLKGLFYMLHNRFQSTELMDAATAIGETDFRVYQTATPIIITPTV